MVLVPRAGEGHAARALRAMAAAAGSGALVDELAYADEDAAAVEALLGDVAVCDDVDAAFAAHARGAEGVRFVTRGGCVVAERQGDLGAAATTTRKAWLARARRLEELAARSCAPRRASARARRRRGGPRRPCAQRRGEPAPAAELAELRGKTDSARAEARRAEVKLAAVRREFEDIERQRGEAERTVVCGAPLGGGRSSRSWPPLPGAGVGSRAPR